MRHPEKWRETVDPHQLPFKNFTLTEILGYPHAGNDVFQVKGIWCGQDVEAFIKVARRPDADIKREIDMIRCLDLKLAPQIIDCDEEQAKFVVTLAKEGERLSYIVGDNSDNASLEYMFEYGQALARVHNTEGDFPPVRDRRFFHVPDRDHFEKLQMQFVWEYLNENRPARINHCFCHGDFHYANILWKDKKMSAILDFELAGQGNREFDIAWAIIRRPGQRFMKTPEEVARFMDGYLSLTLANVEWVRYYMVLIYSYFYEAGKDDPEYQEFVRCFLHESCR